MNSVDNRRTMCDHCSLRRDLPGFISESHVDGNIMAIKSGELFKCHMIHDPTQDDIPNRVCLGAALVAGTPLANSPAKDLPPVHESLEDYRQTQIQGRVSSPWLMMHADKWTDKNNTVWFGWWAKAPAGSWHYLLTTLDSNQANSVYLYFTQCEELFGPLDKG